MSREATNKDNDGSTKAKRPQGAAIGSGFTEQKLGELSDRAILLRLWTYMRPYRLLFALSLLLLPLVSAVSLVQPWLLQMAIDDHFIPVTSEGLHWIILAFGGTVVGRALLEYIQFYVMQAAGQYALRDLRQEVFDHVQGLSSSFFKKNPVGRLMARMTTDIESLQEALSSGMITMIGDIITLVGIVAILLYANWELAMASFTVLPILLALTALFRYYLRKAFREIRVKIARLYAHLQESITGMTVIQLFVRENVSRDEYRDINKDYLDANVRSIRYDAMLYSLVETIGSIAIGAIIWYGSGQVLQDAISLGLLVAFIEYMQKFFVPIRDLAQKYNLLQSAMASSERVFQLIDTNDALEIADELSPVPQDALEIEFRNVWFAYSDEEWILKDVSFRIRPCEKIAFVGHTGAGKTTVTNLLMRLYDVTRGQILVNGVDIREFDLQAYRRRFAVVLQDCFLFQGTIFDNLTLGDDAIPREEVVAAARIVHADHRIEALPRGYDNPVAERGSNLSSGEKQLLSFARALVRKPDVLILDEATANVDTDTEALIQDAIENLMARQTSLVIAHRLSTIQTADRIIVLHKGELLEQGSHDELIAIDGHYSKLYRLQYAAGPSSDQPREILA